MRYVVEGQKIRPFGRPHEVASDSIEFIEVEFFFSKEWEGLQKTAQFTQGERTYNRNLVEDKCKLPVEITEGLFKVSVFGYAESGIRGTTAPINENLKGSGFVSDGEDPIPPTPDLYAQLIAQFNTAIQNSVPIIGKNGNWWLWNPETGVYEDSKTPASGSGSSSNAVQYVEQALTKDQKTQARQNIGAASSEEVSKLSEDKLDKTALPTAINDALAQAKASGEFDGAPGKDGEDGKDGYTPVKGVDYFDGAQGPAGADGKTPIKGKDYFTDEDKSAIVDEVLAALPTWTGGAY